MTDSYPEQRMREIRETYEAMKDSKSGKLTLTPINGSGDILFKVSDRDIHGRFRSRERVIKKEEPLDFTYEK